jgi:hypothetical protein
MSRWVKVASVLFTTRAEKGGARARDIVVGETADVLRSLRGYGLDLVVFCEGVESVAQCVVDAEELSRPGPLLQTYMEFAAAEGCHVAGSVKLSENGHVFNSLAFIGPAGEALGAYHKANLTLGEIDEGLSSGAGAVVVDTAIGRLGGAICFDLNFEVLRAEYRALQPDIVAFASMYHGGLMQGLWAYECRGFFVAALPMLGGGILDPFGRPVALTSEYTPVAMASINLDRAMVHLDYNRTRFAEIEREYLGQVVIDVPPHVGPALITSLAPERSALDIVAEFELELLDDYFARAVRANEANRPETTPANP